MKFIQTNVPGVQLIEPSVYGDRRGFFLESYNRKLFFTNGIRETFVQDNQSRSSKGVLRGLHYQLAPRAQAKLVRVIRGRIFDVAVDIRRRSKTFGKFVTAELGAEDRRMIYIPKGFAHGFLALEEGTEVLYKVSDFYSPAHERGIRWDDPSLGILWPKMTKPYELSERDRNHPALCINL